MLEQIHCTELVITLCNESTPQSVSFPFFCNPLTSITAGNKACTWALDVEELHLLAKAASASSALSLNACSFTQRARSTSSARCTALEVSSIGTCASRTHCLVPWNRVNRLNRRQTLAAVGCKTQEDTAVCSSRYSMLTDEQMPAMRLLERLRSESINLRGVRIMRIMTHLDHDVLALICFAEREVGLTQGALQVAICFDNVCCALTLEVLT